MKKNNSAQNIRSKFVKEALVDAYNLSRSLQENSDKIIRELLQESVKEEFGKILKEGFDDENKEDDTEYTEDVPEISDVDDANAEHSQEEKPESDIETPENSDANSEINSDDDDENSINSDNMTSSENEEEGSEDEWSDFDEFKVSDGEYDLTSTTGDEVAKVYKLMGPNDAVRIIKKDDDKIQIKDTENNTEYLIDMSGSEASCNGDSCDNSSDFDTQMEENNMNEETLKEFDSKVGYTDSYQKSDVMTNDGVKEPAPNKVNDWDKGVPHDTKKPWGGEVKKEAPFNKGVNEEEEAITTDNNMSEGCDETIDEANLSQSRWNDTHAAHNRVPAANKDEFRRDGIQKTSKGTKYRATGTSEIAEDIKKIIEKAKEIYNENVELRQWTNKFRTNLNEMLIQNKRLGGIVSILMNNSTTLQEKKNIVDRFNSANSIKELEKLHETISQELKNKPLVNESLNNIDKQFNATGSKLINEKKVVTDEGLRESLDLMKRLQKY